VARTSAGLVNRARRASAGGAAAAGPGQGDEAMEAAAAPEQAAAAAAQLLPASAELLCVTVDGQGRDTREFMSLRLVHTPSMAQASRARLLWLGP
jgi:hypothetical protein